MTYSQVIDIFQDYLATDDQCEVLQTKHGWSVLLWDSKGKDWSNCDYCNSPASLYATLEDYAVMYHTYKLLLKSGKDELSSAECLLVNATKEHYDTIYRSLISLDASMDNFEVETESPFNLSKLQKLQMKRDLHLQAIRRYQLALANIEKEIDAELQRQSSK